MNEINGWQTNLPEEWCSTVREGGNLPQWAWPGGYMVLYLETPSHDVLCAKCATKALREEAPWRGGMIHGPHYEGPSEHCAECNRELESDYGDPDEPEATEATVLPA